MFNNLCSVDKYALCMVTIHIACKITLNEIEVGPDSRKVPDGLKALNLHSVQTSSGLSLCPCTMSVVVHSVL